MNPVPAYFDCGSASRMDGPAQRRALAELHLRQSRLGTGGELPEDFQRVCALAHLIRNRLTAELLLRAVRTAGLDRRDPPAAAFSHPPAAAARLPG